MRFADSKSLFSFILISSCLALPACGSDGEQQPQSEVPALGSIGVTSMASADGQSMHSIEASFSENYDAIVAECTTRTEGACTLYTCKESASDGGTEKYLTAGTLTVSGGLLAPPGVVLEPEGFDNFYHKLNSGKAWDAGQLITVKSTGAEVPAFQVSVSAPGTVTLEAPVVPAKDQTMTIERSAGLEFRWSGPKETKYVLLVTTGLVAPGKPNVSVACTFPSDATTSTIPASVLGQLPAGETYLQASTRNRATTIVNGKGIRLHARTVARAPSGEPVQRNVTLE